ncbi:MAG: ribonuclease III [Nevskiales bacterium]|nr:ribonuclease III [Nevskiales bacterium]
MTFREGLEPVAQRLGYTFRDPALLAQALTHRSASAVNNERLEFLGDAVINLVIGEALFHARPDAEEGDLSRLRASLVCETALAGLAERLQLGDALIMGSGEMKSGGFRRHSILADALEAVLGAVYLDGGFAPAMDVGRRLFEERLAQLPDAAQLKDAKTRLQEFLQAHGRPCPVYELQASAGPAHRQRFTLRCHLSDGDEETQGQGVSRKQAEQAAAEKMLKHLLRT